MKRRKMRAKNDQSRYAECGKCYRIQCECLEVLHRKLERAIDSELQEQLDSDLLADPVLGKYDDSQMSRVICLKNEDLQSSIG